MEPGSYGTDGTDPGEASGVLEAEATLEDLHGVRAVLATGWSPPARPWALADRGPAAAAEGAGATPATTVTGSATPPAPTASCATTRSATGGPAGWWTRTTAAPWTPTTSCTPGTRASTAPRPRPRRLRCTSSGTGTWRADLRRSRD